LVAVIRKGRSSPAFCSRFGAVEATSIATAASLSIIAPTLGVDKLLRRPVAGLGVELIEPVCLKELRCD
jgi:hypothetical protein